MRRLFLRFYLFILLVLLAIGWSVERLWEQSQSPDLPGWVELLGQSLAYQLTTPDLSAEQVAAQLNLPLQTLPAQSIAWSEAEQQALERGQLVPLFSDNQVYFYQTQQNQLLQFGPVQVEAPVHNTYLFTLLFFLLLGVALAGWLWPVARDIERLQRQLHQFGQGMQLPDPPLPDSSLLAPIARSVRQMANQIIRLMSLQREMTHAVSHELRTPLARLKFALELQPLADSEKHAMQQDLAELDQLVDEMLDYARLEAQTVRLTFEEVDLVELLENLLEKLAPLPGAPILLQRPARLRWTCDGHYLERALQNLLLNAKRYARSQVMLTVQQHSNRLHLVVEDDGPGIPPDQREAILQPFVRVDQSRSRDKGGFGLGLAIVSRIVGWHQGRLWIDDSLLGGARFSLSLPAEHAGSKKKPRYE
ncbi:MAG: ATP-binding protein [Rheinheimera sp.]|nr:ATP-binding protein [Rheinheimera sp.]